MSIIHQLSAEVIACIAAGEVIERPAYVVKELIDNAVDSQASRIYIECKNSGLTSIVVSDNGIGMSPEDLEQSWKLHTTSKISSSDDLGKIRTLGFRGEALASIAAVSTLTIQSRQDKEVLGSEVEIKNQKSKVLKKIGMPIGTRVIVEDLFTTTPARQKFLKSSQTELRKIIDIVKSFVVSHPHIYFHLKHNNKTLLEFSPVKKIVDRLVSFLSEQEFSRLIPIRDVESYIKFEGYIAHPSQAKHRPQQFVIINRRCVTSPLISEAIREAVRELVPSDQSVSFFLYITIPPELIDVNVHPRKEIVQFESPQTVYNALFQATQKVFSSHDITFQSTLSGTDTFGSITHTLAGEMLKNAVMEKTRSTFSVRSLHQIHTTYIVAETTNGIVLIDQHAAEERILYEKFKIELLKQKKKKNKVCIPVPFTLQDKLILQEHRDTFKKLGFSFDKKFVVKLIPLIFSDRDPLPILEEMIADISNGLPIRDIDSLTHRMLTYLACRSAVKAGDKLTNQQMKTIINTLFVTENKYTCPHGRPTMIEVSISNLHKLFKRL